MPFLKSSSNISYPKLSPTPTLLKIELTLPSPKANEIKNSLKGSCKIKKGNIKSISISFINAVIEFSIPSNRSILSNSSIPPKTE